MAKKVWLLMFVIAILVIMGGLTLKGFGKEEGLDKGQDIGIISAKIDEILKNQEDIITRLEDIRKELDIIRVRASRR